MDKIASILRKRDCLMIDKPLLVAVVALLTLSLVMSYSLSVYTVLHFHYDDFHFFIRQGMAVLVGFLIMVLLSKMEADIWFNRIGFTLFFLFFGLMFVMQILPVSLVKAVGGAKRWIHFHSISIAPVEFFKIGFVFFLGWSFSRRLLVDKTRMGLWKEIKLSSPYIGVFIVVVFVIAFLQKDLGQVVVLGATLLILFIFAGSSWKFFFLLIGSAVTTLIALIYIMPYRIERIKSWWGTVQDNILAIFPFESVQNLRIEAQKEPWQISNSLNAIYHGGFFGEGFGNGQFKLGYLSEVHTDFILSGITEELGLLGLSLVSFTILFIIYRIFKIASRVQNPIYYLFSIGVGLLIAFSFILNSYGIAGITPIKGIAVPFLSYGGSHIVASCIAIGMVLMVSKKVSRDENGRII